MSARGVRTAWDVIKVDGEYDGYTLADAGRYAIQCDGEWRAWADTWTQARDELVRLFAGPVHLVPDVCYSGANRWVVVKIEGRP